MGIESICSLSNLSIYEGDEVYLLPLLPKDFHHGVKKFRFKGLGFNFEHVIPPNNHHIYTHAFFQPFALPIKGEYDYNSSLVKIKEDDNTKAIEAFFGISIKEFIDCITLLRGIWDHDTPISKHYSIDKKIMASDNGFGESFLKALGFLEKEKRFVFPHAPELKVEIFFDEKKETGFILYDSEGTELKKYSGFYSKKTFMETFLKHADWYLNVSNEHQMQVKILENASSMYIQPDMYHYAASKEDERTLKAYDELQELIIEHNKEKIGQYKSYDEFHHPLSSNGKYNAFNTHLFGDWAAFREIYGSPIEAQKLRSEFASFMTFHWFMYDANRMYFPARTASPDNNDKAYLEFLKKTQEVLERRIEKNRDEEE